MKTLEDIFIISLGYTFQSIRKTKVSLKRFYVNCLEKMKEVYINLLR